MHWVIYLAFNFQPTHQEFHTQQKPAAPRTPASQKATPALKVLLVRKSGTGAFGLTLPAIFPVAMLEAVLSASVAVRMTKINEAKLMRSRGSRIRLLDFARPP